jgi:hypothetical protein
VRSSRITAPRLARRHAGRALVPVTAIAAVCALIGVSGCADTGGVRLEGAASTSKASPSPTVSAGKVNPVTLLKQDPKVREEFKEDVKPCPGTGAGKPKKYPVEAKYGYLTDSRYPDILINLSTCGDGTGLGVYVYQQKGGSYQNVFIDETPPVHGEIGDSYLEIIRKVYTDTDAVCCPTGKSVTTYAWTGGWFSEISHSRAVGK